jgi:hypothetical protein
MMTKYQDINVPRERKMFMDHVLPKAFDTLRILPWRIGVDGSYEEGRRVFLSGKYNKLAHSKQYLDAKGIKPSDFGATGEFQDVITSSKEEYSHLLVIDEGYDVNDRILAQFEHILNERNNTMLELHLITAVWASKTKIGNFTLNPDGKIKTKWPKYPKIQQLYSPDGLSVEKDAILVAPYTAGPMICMSRRAVILIENMGDKLDFLAILLGLGIQLHADARIQV